MRRTELFLRTKHRNSSRSDKRGWSNCSAILTAPLAQIKCLAVSTLRRASCMVPEAHLEEHPAPRSHSPCRPRMLGHLTDHPRQARFHVLSVTAAHLRNGPGITSRFPLAGCSTVRRGSPDPAVCRTARLPPVSGLETFGRRSGKVRRPCHNLVLNCGKAGKLFPAYS